MCKKTFYSLLVTQSAGIASNQWHSIFYLHLNAPYDPLFSSLLFIPDSVFPSMYLVYGHCCLDFGLFQKPKKLLDCSMVSTSTTPPPPYPHAPPPPPKTPNRSPVNPLTQGPFHSWLTRLNRFQRQMWCFSVLMWQKILLSSCIVKAESGKTEERVSNL